MTTFKTKMGEQNYKILNALRHKAENKEKERVAANTQERTQPVLAGHRMDPLVLAEHQILEDGHSQ